MNRKTFLSTCLFALSTPFTGISSIFEKKDKWNKGINRFYYEDFDGNLGVLTYFSKDRQVKMKYTCGKLIKNENCTSTYELVATLHDDRIYTLSNIRHVESVLEGKYIEFEII